MYHFTQMYDSPRGLRIREYDAETREQGEADAKAYCERPCLEHVALSYHREPSGDSTDYGRCEPAEVAEKHLDPDVAPSHRDHEQVRTEIESIRDRHSSEEIAACIDALDEIIRRVSMTPGIRAVFLESLDEMRAALADIPEEVA